MPWSLPGARLAISKGLALVRPRKSAKKACDSAGIAVNGSISGTHTTAGGEKSEDKSNPTAVWPNTRSYYKGRRVLPEDQIKVHLQREEAKEARALHITHYGKIGPAFQPEAFLSMAAEIGNPASKYVSGRVDFNGTESLQLLELAKGWLQECSTSPSHKNCLSEDRRLPSRVLDARDGLQLRETKNLFGKYATLSYCWGGGQPTKLLTTNRSDYMQGICSGDTVHFISCPWQISPGDRDGSRTVALDLWELKSTFYDEAMGSAVFDIVDSNAEAAEVYCLLVGKVFYKLWPMFSRIKYQKRHTWQHWVLGGLLLVPDNTPGALPNTYHRVGLFHVDPDYDNRFISAAKEESLRLV
ncbi:hypothetical protein G7Y89_g5232 [Cudoniella acicularis]|uniref:Uncharacterized protein n=1 Tax=Cudoniella acicularis TaxID=354080 RepID=A0A8H4W470_9HELO|nr:hypothetical protein G7Y89_g5232 [Cudoniella acicularis]